MIKKWIRVNKYSKYSPMPGWLKRWLYEKRIKRKCKIPTKSGIFVQSQGEKKIADFLFDNDIEFEYDKLMRFGEEGSYFYVRPDFKIKNKNIVIEYWGEKYNRADNPTYDEKAEKKIALYKQEEMHLIEVFAEHLSFLESYLRNKLREARFKKV